MTPSLHLARFLGQDQEGLRGSATPYSFLKQSLEFYPDGAGASLGAQAPWRESPELGSDTMLNASLVCNPRAGCS